MASTLMPECHTLEQWTSLGANPNIVLVALRYQCTNTSKENDTNNVPDGAHLIIMNNPFKPSAESIISEDDKIIVCLASFPITSGHTIVIWKDDVSDLHLLNRENYEYLMDNIDKVRNTLIKVLNIEKVYLLYMDEAKHVHWHLIPSYNEHGFDVFTHDPKETHDFSIATLLREEFSKIR